MMQRCKMHKNLGKLFFYPIDNIMISPHVDLCIRKWPGLCTMFVKTSKWYLKCMLYHAVIETVWTL